MKKVVNKSLSYYLGLSYPVHLAQQEEGWFFVKIPDLPGCMSEGETPDEAIRNIAEAKKEWLEDAIASEYEIPLPSEMRSHSGKFLVRLPVSLHERLAEQAEREGVSLNSYVTTLLAERNALRIAPGDGPGTRSRTAAVRVMSPDRVEHVAEKPRVKYRAARMKHSGSQPAADER